MRLFEIGVILCCLKYVIGSSTQMRDGGDSASQKREALISILEARGLMKRGPPVHPKTSVTQYCHNVSGFALISDDTTWDLEQIASFVAAEPRWLKSYVRDGHCYSEIPSAPFITMSEQRSGSTWFKEMLNGHPCIFMYGEMFMRPEKRRQFDQMLTYPQQYIAKIPDTKPPTCQYWAIGMKAFYFTTALPTTLNPKNKKLYSRVMTFMKQRGRFINMERHNFLDRFISETRASTPGIGGHCQKIKGCDPNAVHSMRWHLKTRAMMQYLRESEKNSKSVAAMLKNSGAPVLDIKYDQLRSQPAAWCSVLNFLGISCADLILLHSSLKKDITQPKEYVIQNYEEVKEALRGSGYEWMLRS